MLLTYILSYVQILNGICQIDEYLFKYMNKYKAKMIITILLGWSKNVY